jgi:Domain of unknown function (DUF5655)/Domain of unknown function (DUF4287)
MAKAKSSIQYDVHPGVAMIQKWEAELPAKSGRALDEWANLVRKQKFKSARDASAWLKKEYGLPTMTAWSIAEFAIGKLPWEGDPKLYLQNAVDYVRDMFAGPKEWQRPVFDEVIAFARTLGKDVRVCPCKTIVPIYRSRVIAELKPATRTRLELALVLGEVPMQGRLVRNPRAKTDDRRQHFVAITPDAGFDAECKKWLKVAYKADA